jgi:hypothetical protein
MTSETSYLLLQSIDDISSFEFENALVDSLRNHLNGAPFFQLDNLSDGISIGYARQFIKEANHLVIICDEMNTDKLGALLPILNLCVKRKNTKIFAFGESPLLKPFMKMMNGKQHDSIESLIESLPFA